MGKLQALNAKNRVENFLLLGLFALLFVYLILQPPLYSPDTYSYLRGDISRFPGYVLFLRGLQLIFKDGFDTIAVGIQLIFGFIAITVAFKNFSSFFDLNWFAKIVFLVVLVFPYGYPLEIANNLTSEGTSYPLYLLLITFATDFLFRGERKKILAITLTFIALVLTRGQFIMVAPIIAFVFIIKLKKDSFKKWNVLLIATLLLLPLFSGILDSSYRKIIYGHYLTTPYSYVNAITLPLFVSEENNGDLMTSEDHKKIFAMSYQRIDSLKLLSSKVPGSYAAKYMRFHNNFPKICNQNIHLQGRAYYYEQDSTPYVNSILIEAACKEMFPVLLQANFKEWAAIYVTGIIHGFKSVFVLFFVIVLALLAFWKTIKKFTKRNGFVLFSSLLLLSNAMIVAVASHSIDRYLFYNYFLGMLIIMILLKKIKSRYEA